ncbi:hypothetical protein K402DRAFT_102129 [Aulographum hederae CBS 113979]|uniref:Uncharacterized protein n=1 Tax=Aulographum hederae CBS 113979 TaxID=1176131 RepID=A0A6G1GYG8_9PEZI|nr:hypothetical protein K402DRAFT_102129 [Aulographum hederae CBS 113979]
MPILAERVLSLCTSPPYLNQSNLLLSLPNPPKVPCLACHPFLFQKHSPVPSHPSSLSGSAREDQDLPASTFLCPSASLLLSVLRVTSYEYHSHESLLASTRLYSFLLVPTYSPPARPLPVPSPRLELNASLPARTAAKIVILRKSTRASRHSSDRDQHPRLTPLANHCTRPAGYLTCSSRVLTVLDA